MKLYPSCTAVTGLFSTQWWRYASSACQIRNYLHVCLSADDLLHKVPFLGSLTYILALALVTPAVFNSTLHPKLRARNRLRMIRHLVLRLSGVPYIYPESRLPPGFIPQPSRTEILNQWRSFLHPDPLTQRDDPLDFPALQDLRLDFSELELLDTEGIIVGVTEIWWECWLITFRYRCSFENSRKVQALISWRSKV